MVKASSDKYLICEVGNRQYKVVPGQEMVIDFQGDDKDIEAKVLLMSADNKLQIGNPYLKETVKLKNLGEVKGEKLRVFKYHSKANVRKVTGSRRKLTKAVLPL